MTPIVFGKRFGWLHPGKGTRGVVLCHTYGHEYVWTYSGMRQLAETLSAQGVWVLRFDYLGTGDSDGADLSPDQFETSVADIGQAIDYLKQETGVEHVTLCGLRLGAVFALASALRSPVDDLVLLAPVMSGRTYMREMSIVRKKWLETLQPPLRDAQPADGPLNVLGQAYHDDFARALEAIDLTGMVKRATVPPARRTLIMQARAGSNASLREAFTALGVDAEQHGFDDLTGFLQETAFTVTPHAAFARVAQWMMLAQNTGSNESGARLPVNWPDLQIETVDAIERPVRIGEEGLFGVLCEPHIKASRGGSVLLLTSTAASSRVGDSRLAVRIARELARRGVASLRFDARGRGDSPPPPDSVQADTPYGRIYNLLATEDAASAARWLSRRGYQSIISFGICSGAYHALRAAVAEPAITGVVSVNILTFKRPTEKKLANALPDGKFENTGNSMAGYAHSIFDWNKWKAIFSGEKDLLRILYLISNYATVRARSRIIDLLHLDRLSTTPPEQAETPLPIMRALDAKSVKTVLLYGSYEPGLDLLASYFGRRGARLSRYPSVRVAEYPDVDHSLFNPACLRHVIGLCETVAREVSPPAQESAMPNRATAVF
jgi:pimeloyl-ACP methyl ester carboxylesterase